MITKLFQALFFAHNPQLNGLVIESENEDWGAGQSQNEGLPPAPTNVSAIPDHSKITITWDPVPDALYYNLYFVTTKGVQIKPCDLSRPIASADDFIPKADIKKETASCIEGASSPYVHNDLANNLCYHYAITVVTEGRESPLSDQTKAIPSPYPTLLPIGV